MLRPAVQDKQLRRHKSVSAQFLISTLSRAQYSMVVALPPHSRPLFQARVKHKLAAISSNGRILGII